MIVITSGRAFRVARGLQKKRLQETDDKWLWFSNNLLVDNGKTPGQQKKYD